MSDLMYWIEKYAKIEDETKPTEQKEANSLRFNRGRGKEKGLTPAVDKRSVFKTKNTVFKEPIFRILPHIYNKPYFRWPEKLLDFPGKADHKDFCSYHNDKGHQMGQCHNLRLHLEDLVGQGHLKDFIDEEKIGMRNNNSDHNRKIGEGEGKKQKKILDTYAESRSFYLSSSLEISLWRGGA